MRTGLTIVATLAACCLSAVIAGEAPRASGQEKADKAVQKRVAELLAIIARPDATDETLEARGKALKELQEIGGPACPQLVEAALGKNLSTAVYVQKLLVEIGKPALPAIRAKWGDLNDERRWKLMPVLEAHDPDSVREYAWNSLDAESTARSEAWAFMLRRKEPRAKERYFKSLRGEEAPGIRWMLIPGEKPIYDEKRENAILIELLDPKSWVAKGDGQIPPAGYFPPWWPDGRLRIIVVLHQRKVVRAAPALLKMLQEKGEGRGYLAEGIIPVLADFGYKEAIPELVRIAKSEPESGKLDEHHPYGLFAWDYEAVRKLATDAIQKIRNAKP